MKETTLFIAGYFLSLIGGALLISAIGMFVTLGHWHILIVDDGAKFLRLLLCVASFFGAAAIVSERHNWRWWQ